VKFIPAFSYCISTTPSDVVLSLTVVLEHQIADLAHILLWQKPSRMTGHLPAEESLSGIFPPVPVPLTDQSVLPYAGRVSDPFLFSVMRFSLSRQSQNAPVLFPMQ